MLNPSEVTLFAKRASLTKSLHEGAMTEWLRVIDAELIDAEAMRACRERALCTSEAAKVAAHSLLGRLGFNPVGLASGRLSWAFECDIVIGERQAKLQVTSATNFLFTRDGEMSSVTFGVKESESGRCYDLAVLLAGNRTLAAEVAKLS